MLIVWEIISLKNHSTQMTGVFRVEFYRQMKNYLRQVGGVATVEFGVFLIVELELILRATKTE